MTKESSVHAVIHSEREDNQHTEGVAIIISDRAAKALMEWKPLGETLIMANKSKRDAHTDPIFKKHKLLK